MLPAFQWEDGVAGRASGYGGNSGFHILLSHRTKTWLGKLPFSILLSAAFNSTWTVNFQMFKLDLEKAEEPEIKLPASVGSSNKQESSGKTPISALLTMPKPLTMWIITNCGKFKRWEYQTTLPASWETFKQVKKKQLVPDIEQTSSKLRKEYVKAVYCNPASLTYMKNISCEMLGWI